MAQTKRKRRTKHRGNAAGMIEARGRTGRRPEPEKGKKAKSRVNKFDQPPTWQSAVNRAAIAAAFLVVLMLLLFKEPIARAIILSGFMFLLYVPLGYYTDLMIYRRRQAKILRERQARQG
jgi:hypothetical protein